jgi:hypothetical protein
MLYSIGEPASVERLMTGEASRECALDDAYGPSESPVADIQIVEAWITGTASFPSGDWTSGGVAVTSPSNPWGSTTAERRKAPMDLILPREWPGHSRC